MFKVLTYFMFSFLLSANVYSFLDRMVMVPNDDIFDDCYRVSHYGMKVIDKVLEDGEKLRYYYKEVEKAEGFLIFYHGSGRSACVNLEVIPYLKDLPVNLVVMEYPGYGGDRKRPSQKRILPNALRMFDEVQTLNEKGLPVFVYGASMGTTITTYVASKRPVSGVVLRNAPTSIADSVQTNSKFPLKWLVKSKFPAKNWATSVIAPVQMHHAKGDEWVPFEMGKRQSKNFFNASHVSFCGYPMKNKLSEAELCEIIESGEVKGVFSDEELKKPELIKNGLCPEKITELRKALKAETWKKIKKKYSKNHQDQHMTLFAYKNYQSEVKDFFQALLNKKSKTYFSKKSAGSGCSFRAYANQEWRKDHCAYFFEHSYYKGKRWEFCPGATQPKGWNDKVSSIIVPKGGKVKVCKHSKERGPCHSYFRDVDSVGGYMNNQISWLKYGPFNSNDFTMVLMSDPQLFTGCKTKECKRKARRTKDQGKLSNKWHIQSLNKIVKGISFDQFGGVIINGNLTAFGKRKEYKAFLNLYESKDFKHNLYMGLGNHDYGKNNVNRCWQNNCALRMVNHIVKRARSYNLRSFDLFEKSYYKFPSRKYEYNGSLGYAFDIGKFRFVQLHNYPTWNVSFNGWNFWKGRRDIVNIRSSFNYIKKELNSNRGKVYIFNWHDPSESFTKGQREKFADMCKENVCPVVFAGNFHEQNGPYNDYKGHHKTIPVYLSGSASYNHYLLVRFQENKLTITKVRSLKGNTEEYGVYTINF